MNQTAIYKSHLYQWVNATAQLRLKSRVKPGFLSRVATIDIVITSPAIKQERRVVNQDAPVTGSSSGVTSTSQIVRAFVIDKLFKIIIPY